MRRLNVGIVGCGNISGIYFENLPLFPALRVAACADLRVAVAELQAKTYGVEASSVDALLARKDIDIVVNLSIPAAHAGVTLAALAAGKHVYSEKPLALRRSDGEKILAEAARRNLQVGVAPDTVLGAGVRTCRELIDAGRLGRIVTGTATICSHGMEHWHPDPEFFFKPGAGPVFDMGPYYIATLVHLLGPATRVGAMTAIGAAERMVTAESPKKGSRIRVETPTTALALLQFSSGAIVALQASWDVWRHGQAPIELHGTEGSLRVPDPNFFGGPVLFTERGGDWQELDCGSRAFGKLNWPAAGPEQANYRGLGIAELAGAIIGGTPHRTSAAMGLHMLRVMEAILESGAASRFIDLPPAARPPALSELEAAGLLS